MSNFIPKEFINSIQKQSNIVDVISEFLSLQKRGNNYIGLCPFHQDNTPSFTVNEAKQIYKCFACNESGNVVTFLTKMKGYSFIEAIEFLAQKLNIDFDFESYKKSNISKYNEQDLEIIETLSLANNFFKTKVLTSKSAKDYLNKRKLDDISIRNQFDIGYAKNNSLITYFEKSNISEKQLIEAGLLNSDLRQLFWDRITFGIRNEYGDIVGFSARALNNSQAKYINSPETHLFKKSELLYNYHNAKNEIQAKKSIIIVEGFMDVIALYKAEIFNVVGLMGTALTQKHIRLLKKYEVNLFLDNDNAGQEATFKSIEILFKANISNVKIIINHLSKDPDEILQNEGKEKLLEILQNKKSAVDFIYDFLLRKFNLLDHIDFDLVQKAANELIRIFSYSSDEIQNYIAEKFYKETNYKLLFVNKQIQDELVPNEIPDYVLNEAPSHFDQYYFKTELDQKYAKKVSKSIIASVAEKLHKPLNFTLLIYLIKFPRIYESLIENESKDAIYALLADDLDIFLNIEEYYENINSQTPSLREAIISKIKESIFQAIPKQELDKILKGAPLDQVEEQAFDEFFNNINISDNQITFYLRPYVDYCLKQREKQTNLVLHEVLEKRKQLTLLQSLKNKKIRIKANKKRNEGE
ncbi:DNA primase [Mycoplasmopsis glycophila]|uniref:DNA primase n=1 Tax=Mycoplasmopsis glycophila TaxID=171285 RepID=A0A449AUN3_9BACT|nr:DNA primase [Mycoplasmopsis glycophila]VEU70234.1 DNA primase [Mycoplasmopsis glycophila]